MNKPAKTWYLIPLSIALNLLLIGAAGGPGINLPAGTATFSVTGNDLNTYNAFLTIGTAAANPIFSRSNFTQLIHDDVIGSPFCSLGCNIALERGSFNATQTIIIDKPSISIFGSLATVIYPQNVTFSSGTGGPLGFQRSLFSINAPNFVAQGFRIDDYLRNYAGKTGEILSGLPGANNCLINQMTIWNASFTAIDLDNNNCITNQNTILNNRAAVATSSAGINVGQGATGHRITQNTVYYFNGTTGAGIRLSLNANGIQVSGNDIEFNAFGIASATFAKAITITNNPLISNNYAAGILLSTPAFGSGSGGPVDISDNTITDNSRSPGTWASCANARCPGIMLTGARPGWDSITITANTIKDTQTIPTQQNAIWLNSIQYSNVTITANAIGRHATTTLIKLTVNPLVSWIITANPGFNPQPKRHMVVGASPYTYTNNDAYMEQLELTDPNGITGLVCRGDGQIIIQFALTPVLNTLDTCVYTWAVTAPEFDVLPLQG